MEHEDDFIHSLRSVVIHHIKHDRLPHPDLVKMIEACDKRTWQDLPAKEKLADVAKVKDLVNELDAYYAEYPHSWSRQRFEHMKSMLDTYLPELSDAD